MDFDNPAVSSGSGILFLLIICLLVYLCCRRRQQQRSRFNLENDNRQQPRGHGRRQKNARRKWRRRRDNNDQSRVVIVEHEAPCPESAVPAAPYDNQPPVHNPQYIINLNPPSQMPFQNGHYPAQGPFQAQQQMVHNIQFPPPPHVSGMFPQNANPPVGGLYVPQQQPGGFAQLYAQAQPDMNVFPQPPPPYETEPFPPLPKQK